jgi:uncharacterized protein (TIGR02246 family)
VRRHGRSKTTIFNKKLHMMTKSTLSALTAAACLLLLTVCTTAQTTAPDNASPDRARAELQERQEGFLAALASRDAAKVAAYFAEDAVLHVANTPLVQGRSAIQAFYGNIFRFLVDSKFTPEVLQLSGSADLAYAHGAVTNVFGGHQGRSEFPGKYLLVWQKKSGAWLVAAYGITGDGAETKR